MKSNGIKIIFYGSFLFTLLGCDSEQKIERTHEEHELFDTRKTKPAPNAKDSVVADSIPLPIPSPDSAKENPK